MYYNSISFNKKTLTQHYNTTTIPTHRVPLRLHRRDVALAPAVHLLRRDCVRVRHHGVVRVAPLAEVPEFPFRMLQLCALYACSERAQWRYRGYKGCKGYSGGAEGTE